MCLVIIEHIYFYEQQRNKVDKMTYAPSEDSDQHDQSLSTCIPPKFEKVAKYFFMI